MRNLFLRYFPSSQRLCHNISINPDIIKVSISKSQLHQLKQLRQNLSYSRTCQKFMENMQSRTKKSIPLDEPGSSDSASYEWLVNSIGLARDIIFFTKGWNGWSITSPLWVQLIRYMPQLSCCLQVPQYGKLLLSSELSSSLLL